MSSRDCNVPQVTPDRHQASVSKMKLKTTIATLNNARKGKLDNIKQEMRRMKINILGFREVPGKISRTFEIFFSGGIEREREVAIILIQDMYKTV